MESAYYLLKWRVYSQMVATWLKMEEVLAISKVDRFRAL